MDSPRSSGHASDHLQPPPSPYPATVDPSPVDSNGTTHTDHTEVDQIVDDYGEQAGLTPPQIEDDAQEDQASEDGMSDIRSPATDDIVSPVSQDGHAKVSRRQLHAPTCSRLMCSSLSPRNSTPRCAGQTRTMPHRPSFTRPTASSNS